MRDGDLVGHIGLVGPIILGLDKFRIFQRFSGELLPRCWKVAVLLILEGQRIFEIKDGRPRTLGELVAAKHVVTLEERNSVASCGFPACWPPGSLRCVLDRRGRQSPPGCLSL